MSTPAASSTRTGPVRLIALTAEPLEPAAVLAAVSDPRAGGVNLFVGDVRDQDGGAEVQRLEYSAHPSAEATLAEVAEEVAAEFPVTAIAAVHRVGALVVGDHAVVIAVSSPHRGTAYDASRALIDRLKERVPIWKHQVFADGSDEWVGSP